jgi:hypothetical protein
MTADEAIDAVNTALGIQGVITTKGDEVKCWVPCDGDVGTNKTYLGVEECQSLADAFGFLAIHLETAQRQRPDHGK